MPTRKPPSPPASAFASAAHDASVPVNVVDKPAFCDFQFGSVVNRSPVVIGISTDGAAPILGQAIRRKIETDPARPTIIRTIRGSGYLFAPEG